ncbi:MAG: HPP family protein [Candidatus Competibacter sp.]|nr:HPP family protein [Candidatus Competibacter sp.]MDG4583072.1 HPP family protein [Candidatus Competibacter sp.]
MEKMNPTEFTASITGAFVGTLAASFFSFMILETEQLPVILASTGASAMLLFGFPHSPVSQPWNLVGGHVVSAVIGVGCHKLIPNALLASAIAIPAAMILMHLLRCMHPPGGATAITAIIGGEAVHKLGFAFVVVPVFINAIILLSVAMSVGTFRQKNPFDINAKTWIE